MSCVNVHFLIQFYVLVKVYSFSSPSCIWAWKWSLMRHYIKIVIFIRSIKPNNAITEFNQIFLIVHGIKCSPIIFNCKVTIIQKILNRLFIVIYSKVRTDNDLLNPFSINPFLELLFTYTAFPLTSTISQSEAFVNRWVPVPL